MLSISPLTQAELRSPTQTTLHKAEVYNGSSWIDLSNFASDRTDILAGWSHRKLIEVSGTYVDSTLTDFPLCVVIKNDWDIGANALSSGYDIRFTSDNGTTLLKYERETFAISGGRASGVFWVKIPSLTTSGVKIFVYYGNASASDGADPTNVWDASFKGVWHLADATTSTTLDSTSLDGDGTKYAANQPVEISAGKAGKAQEFDGTGDYIQVTHKSGQVMTHEMSASLWVNSHADLSGKWPGLFLKTSMYGTLNNGFGIRLAPTHNAQFWVGNGTSSSSRSIAISKNEWHHLAMYYHSGVGGEVFVDGVAQNTLIDVGDISTPSVDCYIGSDDAKTQALDGYLDEVRLSSSYRSNAWFKFEYRNIAESDNCLTFNADETLNRNLIKSMSCSVAGAGKATEPMAGSWSLSVDNKDGIFHPYHPTSAYTDLLRLGRKVRLSWGLAYRENYFDDGELDDWTSSTNLNHWSEFTAGSSTVNRESSSVHSGSYSARLDIDSSGNSAGFGDSYTDIPTEELMGLSFWYKNSTTGKTGYVLVDYTVDSVVHYLQSDGTWKISSDPGFSYYIVLPNVTDWTQFVIAFTTPANYGGAMYFEWGKYSATSSSIYYDDLRLTAVESVKTSKYWQRVIGYMDTPRFDLGDQSVSISGTDYMKCLADTELFSPWTNWGDSETFDSKASPGGTGTEVYDEADALEIGTGEADNVTNWSSGSPAGTVSSEGPGDESDYFLHFIRDVIGPTTCYTQNTDVGSVTAGNQYLVTFWARVNGDHSCNLGIYQTVGASTYLIGTVPLSGGGDWIQYEKAVTVTSTGAMKLRLNSLGKYATATDSVDLDEMSIKLYDPTTWNIYELPEGCNGIYYVTLNGSPVWQGDEDGSGGWHYDPTIGVGGALSFSEELVIDAGTDNLIIYYYTATAPEDVVADLLVAASLYTTRALAKAAMDYTATGITIPKVWFDSGASALDAIRLICERVNYRFWFAYDGTPSFVPAPTKTTPSTFDFTSVGQVSSMNIYQDIEEVRNHITIEGCERSVLNVSTGEVEESNWKASAEDSTSIAAYQRKTYSLSNHLFQDQTTMDTMATSLLAEYKTPKYYLDFSVNFLPVPLEIGDTVTLIVPVSTTQTVTKYGIIRGISLNDNEATYTCEVYLPYDTLLVVQQATLGLASDNVALDYPAALVVQEAVMGLTAESPNLITVYEYTTTQTGTSLSCPTGTAVIECWGMGGDGGDGEMVGRAGGGGGGAYSKTTVSVTSGQSLLIYLPAAGDGNPTYVTRSGVTLCLAAAGEPGDLTGGGSGGPSADGTGDTKYSGGNGYFYATGYTGGGGGGSAGTASNGNNATSSTGATAVTGGGNGGNGGARYNDGDTPTGSPGGGGGGAGSDLSTERYGGAGKIGKVRVTFS